MLDSTVVEAKEEVDLRQSERNATASASAIVIAVIVVVGAYTYLTCEPFLTGTFGDSFGVLTSLFTGIALAGLWYTIRLQKIELKATRHELKGQKTHMAQQAYALSKQNFENTFYRIIGMIDDRAGNLIDPGTNDPLRKGRKAFVFHVQSLNGAGYLQSIARDAPRADVEEVYRRWYASNSQELEAYFQLLYEALNTVDLSKMLSPQRYADVLRALLSPAEKHVLYYHGVSGVTDANFRPLLAKYKMFDGFDFTKVAVIPPSRREWLNQA